MPRLVDVVSAPPPYLLPQELAEAFARDVLVRRRPQLARLMPIFAHAGIETRHVARPLGWYREPHGLDEASAVYLEVATAQCAAAARALLDRAGLPPTAIDRILYVNTTGLATPSIDARLINVLGLRADVERTPIWGLGCAGGASGLAHAYHLALGHARERVLVCACETCSLTLRLDDLSPANVVATALFGDGAAAALIVGDDAPEPGYPLTDARTVLYPDSLGVMGWNVVAGGLQVVFDRRIPEIVHRHARAELDALLAAHGLVLDEIAELLYHPGGPKVLGAYAEAYGVPRERFHYSIDVLREHGNMSSVTVLYVLERYLAAHRPGCGGHAIISALGPGFSSSSVVMDL